MIDQSEIISITQVPNNLHYQSNILTLSADAFSLAVEFFNRWTQINLLLDPIFVLEKFTGPWCKVAYLKINTRIKELINTSLNICVKFISFQEDFLIRTDTSVPESVTLQIAIISQLHYQDFPVKFVNSTSLLHVASLSSSLLICIAVTPGRTRWPHLFIAEM